MDSQSQPHGHIVMLPFMAHGHLIPFLALARHICRQTPFVVTLATTPLNLRSTMSPSDTDSRIRLHELPFCSSKHGLPPDTENTENLSYNEIPALCHSSVSLDAPLEHLISDIVIEEGRPPLCVVSDVIFGWSVDVARRLGTKSIAFTTCGAYATLAYVSLWLGTSHYVSLWLHLPHRSKFFQVQLKLSLGSDGWLCNSVEEIEPLGLDLLRKYSKLPVWAIVPLVPSHMLQKSSPISPKSTSMTRENL